MLACLLPLLLAGYLLHTLNRNAGNEDQQVAEFFLAELASDKPLLLPVAPRPAALEHSPPVDESALPSNSSEDDDA